MAAGPQPPGDRAPLAATDFELRDLEPEDVDRVLALENEIFIDPWIRESFEAEIRPEEGVHWARTAWRGSRLAGYVVAWFVLDEVHLANIAVAKIYRHLGLGGRLLECVLDEARQRASRWIGLEVRQSNEGAQAFYRTYGFRPVGIRKGYYRVGSEDALVMALELDQNELESETV